MTPEESVIYGWCRVIVDARMGKFANKQLQEIEGQLLVQKGYVDAALHAIKLGKEGIRA